MNSKSDVSLDNAADDLSVEERIRTRAYYLWQNASDPKGTPDEYWDEACAEIEKEGQARGAMDKGARTDDKVR
ncbi:MAG: DUF2934 domain-containing protein [Paraburkholderia sp.]|nr:DUF2934 domain-containing protein [Paraburkholderia sp.]